MAFRNTYMQKRRNQRPVPRGLLVEKLDFRLTMDGTASSAAALPWIDLGALTYSFAPDGTSIGGSPSELFSDLSSIGEKTWQDAFQDAFRQWFDPFGMRVSEVKDDGLPFGIFGATQGDSRFGDIRIAAVPLSGNVAAEAVPHSIITQGTWAGDILLNANFNWASAHEVFSVAMHEIGHVLGLGHNPDPASPMYFHGVSDALAPTPLDLVTLKMFYAALSPEMEDGDGDEDDNKAGSQPSTSSDENVAFDPATATSLSPIMGATIQYAATGKVTDKEPRILYRLESAGDIDDFSYLNIVIESSESEGLIPEIIVYNSKGEERPARILSNANGTKVIQFRDVEAERVHYVAVSGSTEATAYRKGSFRLFANYNKTALSPTQIGAMNLDANQPIAEQSFQVTTSRLVHLMVASTPANSLSSSRIGKVAVWANLVDSQGNTVARLAMAPGDTRSAPLTMLQPGEYRLILQTGSNDGRTPVAVKLKIYLDEISIDVGVGTVDPATQPVVTCATPGANPLNCVSPPPVIFTGGPVYPNPATLPTTPAYPSTPPWNHPSWFYWPSLTIASNGMLGSKDTSSNSGTGSSTSGDSAASGAGSTSGTGLGSAANDYAVGLNALGAANAASPVFRQNSGNPLDVSNDRQVTALDILLIVDQLSKAGAQSNNSYFYDTNGDGQLTPIDALLVINQLRQQPLNGAGEGPLESPPQNSLASADWDPVQVLAIDLEIVKRSLRPAL